MKNLARATRRARSLVRACQGVAIDAAFSRPGSLTGELSFSQLLSRSDYDAIYRYAHSYFARRAPQIIRDHRSYFRSNRRGFGEDAFHTMWWLLMLERHPTRMLEIGVYRGQVISLWALIGKYLHKHIEAHGVSPLSDYGDEVSYYPAHIDYESDVRRNYEHFGLGEPLLTRALSNEPQGVAVIAHNGPWDVIYIDGSHDPDIVVEDYRNASRGLADDGLIVLDDAALYLPYRPPPVIASHGHPGPSTIARDVVSSEMKMLGAVGHNVIFSPG